MTLIVDDLLVRPFMFILESLHTMAINELYDVDAIQDEIKENQLLYEIGERNEEEYLERKQALEEELEIAEAAREQLANKTIEVRG